MKAKRKATASSSGTDETTTFVVQTKKFGGVKVTLQRADRTPPNRRVNLPWPAGDCVCGKTFQQCGDEWDARLGITGRTNEDYAENLRKVRSAEIEGLDPYCRKAQRKAESDPERHWHWTPHMPPGSFVPPTTIGGKHGKRTQGDNRITSSRGSGITNGSSRGERKGTGAKSVRRKR